MQSHLRVSARTALAALLIISFFSTALAWTPAVSAQGAGSGKISVENLDRIPYNDRLVFHRSNGDPETEVATHRVVTLRINNTASTPLNVSKVEITGADADMFSIVFSNRGPFTIAPNEFRDIPVTFGPGPSTKRTVRALRFADMIITSSDPNAPQTKVELAGFNQPAQQGSNEPTLDEMMLLFGYRTDIVNPGEGERLEPPNIVHGDEVISNQWTRASTNAPVYVRQLAAFSGDKREVSISLSNCAGCTVAHSPIDFHTVLPLQTSLTTPRPPVEMTVTPGANFVVTINGGYKSDQTDPRRVRFWVVRDRNGQIVRNTYVVGQDTVSTTGCRNATTQANCDYQDNVYLITNIRPSNYADDPYQIGRAPGNPGLVLDFDQTYPNSLNDRDGQGIGFTETQRNKVDAPLVPAAPSSSYDASKLNIDPSGPGTLTVTTVGSATTGSNTGADNSQVNNVCLPFDGRTSKFVASTRIRGPLTNVTKAFTQGGVMVGTSQVYFVKLVAGVQQTFGTPPLVLQFALENRNQQTQIGPLVTLPSRNFTTLDLQLIGDPATGTFQAAYSIDGATPVVLADRAVIPAAQLGRFFGGHNTGCLTHTNKGTDTAVDFVFDRFAVELPIEANAPRQVINGPNGQPLRFNTGGPERNINGRVWRADTGLYEPSSSPNEAPGGIGEIAYTSDDAIYRDYRGQSTLPDRSLTYEIPLASSTPQYVAARLHFAELFWGRSTPDVPQPNRRVFDVYAEGKLALRDVDISAMSGGALKALTSTIENIFVTDGSLTLKFVSTVDNTSIAAIEVLDTPTGAPIVNAGADQKVAPRATVNLSGSAFDNDPPYTYQWTQLSGTPVTLTTPNALQTSFTAGGTYEKLVFELKVTNADNESGTDTVEITVGDIPVQGLTIATNSPQAVDTPMNFTASVAAGENVTYTWNFGDNSPAATGKTVQHTYAELGSYTVTVTATNNTSTATATATVSVVAEQPFEVRINAGGAAVTTPDGKQWAADVNFSGGRVYPTTGPVPFDIAGTTNDIIYQTERGAVNTATAFSYNIPVSYVDDYVVTLHFAEIYWTGQPTYGAAGPGRRVFNANIEGGATEITGLDLNAVVGPLTAYAQSFTTRVTDGTLNIQFTSTTNNAKISAIEVVRVINQPPTVNAGPDQAVQPGAQVQLSGSVSDPEGKPVTFSWSQIAGPAVTLANPTTLTPSFTAAVKGTYTFRLSAVDGDQVPGSDTVTIVAANRAPVITSATATPATVNVGQASALSATATDADSDTLTYAWAQTGGPTGGALTGATTANASFTPAAKGTYTFTVTVSDGDTGGSTTATVTVTARNRAPVITSATATPATVDVGQASALSATATDADSDTLTYAWTQTGGPAGGAISGTGTANASFTPAAKGTYTFAVTVSDGDTGGTATANVTVTARNRAPVANAGPDQSVDVGEGVQLAGSGSSDPDSDSLTFAWTQTGGTPVTLTGGTTASPSFLAPAQPATLTFQLVVTDSEGLASSADSVTVTVNEVAISGLSASGNGPTVLGQPTTFAAQVSAGSNVTYAWDFGDGETATGASVQHTFDAADTYTVKVTATNSLGSVTAEIVATVTNTAPVANAGAAQTVTVGAAVTLSGAGSSDPDGHTPLTYAWTQTGGPDVTLSSASAAAPTFTAPAAPAVLAFQLVVTDARGLASEPASVLVTVRDSAPQNVTASNNGPTTLGQATTLTATASGTNLTYSWDFGDGETATGATATHTYADEGSYVATVTVSNSTGTVGSASTGVVVTNAAPAANAGADRGVDLGVAVTLNASASSDPDGHTPLTFAWAQLSGPTVTLTGAETASATFTAPNQPAILLFQVTVTDSRGKSASDTVRIAVGDEPIEGLQAASSGPTVLGRATTFTASIAGGTNVAYVWDFGGGRTATGASAQFTFGAEGSFPVTLTATNGTGSVSRTITVVVTNAAPTVNAGADRTVLTGSAVALAGTAGDPDGHTPLSYSWEQTSGTPVTLAGAKSATASFTAPGVEGQLAFRLTVTDARGKKTSDAVTIAVRKNVTAPAFRVFLPSLLNGSGSTVATPADLTISKITATPTSMASGVPAQISVTVTNKGSSATGPFWVDLYINPNKAPTAAGVTWETTCTLVPCHGIAWLVKDGLQGGQSIVLTSEATSYYGANTRWFGSFAPGTSAIYAYADSWNLSNPVGIVAEGDEANNRGELILPGLTNVQPRTSEVDRPQLPERTLPGN